MALPESSGGDGATLVDLTLVAEELGRALAPVPWIDHVCAARLLARLGTTEPDVANGKQLVALDPRHDNVNGVRLIPAGSIARAQTASAPASSSDETDISARRRISRGRRRRGGRR